MNSIQLQGAFSDLSVKVALDGFLPEPSFAPLTHCSYAGSALVGFSGTLRMVGSALDVELVGAEGSGSVDYHALEQLPRGPVEATLRLQDGSSVESPVALFIHRQMRSGDVNQLTATMRLHDWRLATPKTPQYWIGTLQGATFTRGNYTISELGARRTRFANDNLRLEGYANWHIIRCNGQQPIAVLEPPSALDAERLLLDFRALEYVLGAPLKLDLLVGLDDAFEIASAAGIGFGFRPIKPCSFGDGPVPDRLGSVERWIPVLFQKLSAALVTDPENLLLAISPSADAHVDHVDGAYLKHQIAIEATCHSVLTKGEPRILVKDPKTWSTWVDKMADEITLHAIDNEAGRKLLNKVTSAMQAPATDVVADGLAALALDPPSEFRKEVTKRNRVAHRYTMGSLLKRDIHADDQRLLQLKTLLAAIICRIVKYDGPLNGATRTDGWRDEASWWPTHSDRTSSHRYFHSSRVLLDPAHGPASPETW